MAEESALETLVELAVAELLADVVTGLLLEAVVVLGTSVVDEAVAADATDNADAADCADTEDKEARIDDDACAATEEDDSIAATDAAEADE